MQHITVRRYIDKNGPITLTKGDLTITVIAHPDSVTDYHFKECITYDDFYARLEPTGFLVDVGGHPYEGFYAFPEELLAELDTMDVIDSYIFELRRLLPAAIEIHKHYEGVPLRVLGLKRTSFRQTQRSTVLIQTGEEAEIDISKAVHRRGGYMFSEYDSTIKHDTVQAWRLRELTREELIEFDPRWGDLVK